MISTVLRKMHMGQMHWSLRRKRMIVALALTPFLALADVTLSDVKVFSGSPWQEVVIGCTIKGTTDEAMSFELTAKDNVGGKTYACKTLEGVSLTPGSHVVKWNASADGAKFKSDDVVFTARVVAPPLYCVVDLSGGTSAASYPVTGLADVPNGGWTDEYKTTKLVLRRVEAGTFKMGDAVRDGQMYDITLTKPFYMGVFEVTQKQWELVMGTRPSYFNHDDYYASRPVEQVSYDMIRGSSVGAGWPANNAVDATSFLGKLRTKTGLDFDLPTAAQWECACRAGTTTDYNNGTNRSGFEQDANMAVVGRYAYNSGYSRHSYVQSSAPSAGTAVVGSYVPNAWGLYDMHGNVWEWCLDWLDWGGLYTATDPKGVSSGSCRVLRGGSWFDDAGLCDSYDQLDFAPSDDIYGVGFRLSRTLQEQEAGSLVNTSGSAVALAEASSASTAVDTTFADGAAVAGPLSVTYGSVGSSGCRVTANNTEIVNSTASGTKEWLPPTGGEYQLVYSCGGVTMESTVIAEELTVSSPVITPCDGSVFKTGTCTVTIACATEGAEIYYTTNGRTPRVAEANRYKGAFAISDTATIVAVAVKGEKTSEYVEATITKVISEPLTLVGVLDELKLADVTTGGDAEWLPIEDATAKVGGSCAVSGALDDDGEEESTWLEAKVYGKGTLTFWWRVNCEPDPRAGKFTYDFAAFEADNEVVVQKDGESEWMQVTKAFTTDGEHVIRWSYNTDGWPSDDYDGCVWVDGVAWSGSAAPEEQTRPTIKGDEGATVTGDAETGFVVKPSEGKTSVEVTIPQGVDAAKVTVEVSTKVASVKSNGAKVKIVSGGADITEFLNVPAADGNGVVDLTKAMVKEEIVKEAMDVEKGAKIELNAANPSMTTPNTRKGLSYQLREGATLGGMKDGDSTVGNGQPWTPEIKVKGGNSAFYSIDVGKGE